MSYKERMAKLLIAKNNFEVWESVIGKVLSPPPELRVSIYKGAVILEPHQLYMNDRLFSDHTRTYSIKGDITEQSMDVTSSYMTKAGQGPHKHDLISWGGSGAYKSEGTIVNTDTLKTGDLVKVTPTENGQKWFVDFKVRKLGG